MDTINKTHLKKLVSKSKTKEAIEGLLNITCISECLKNEVILLSSRFKENENGKHMNTSTSEAYKTEVAQINTALLHLIDKLPEKENKTDVREIEQAYKNDIVKVELKINTNFNDFTKDDQNDLKKAISLLLGLDGDIDIKFRKGSVIAEFELPLNLAERLKALIETEKFSDYDVLDLKINESNSKKSFNTQLKTSNSSIKQRRFRLIDLLNSFSPKEIESFIEFTNSEYHNKNKQTIVLLNFLLKNVIHMSDFNESLQIKAYNIIFQIKKQPAIKLNNHQKKLLLTTMSLLKKLAEEFLCIDMLKYKSSDKIKTELLLTQLQDKNQIIYFSRTIKKQQKKLDSIIAKSIENYEEHFYIELNNLYFNRLLNNKEKENAIEKLNEYIEIVYVLNKCKLFVEHQYKYQNFISKDLDILEDVSLLIEKPGYLNIPIINAYATTALLLKTNDVSYYSKLIDLLNKNIKYLPKNDLNVFYFSAINFCKKKIGEGENSFYEDIYEHYKTMYDNSFLILENNLNLLKDIIKVSSKIGQYSWAHQITKKHSSLVGGANRDSVYHFNAGTIAFYKDNYKKALNNFIKVDKVNLTYDIDCRIMILKCHYELDTEYTEQTMRAFLITERYIQTIRILTIEDRKAYKNFIRILINLYKRKHEATRNTMESLLAKIEKTKFIFDKKWLLQKIKAFNK